MMKRLTDRDIEIILSEVREYFNDRADAEYFNDRADAEYFPDRASPVVNDEMSLLVAVDDLADELRRRGVMSPPQTEGD